MRFSASQYGRQATLNKISFDKFPRRASAHNPESAQRRVKILMASETGVYVIYSQETGRKTFVRCNTDAQPSFPPPD